MRNAINSTHPFWKHVHPPEEGWLRCHETWFDTDFVKLAYKRNGYCRLVLQCTKDAYVSRQDVARASELISEYKSFHPGTLVQVVLAYGQLLMPPTNLPLGVEVISITIEMERRGREMLMYESMN